MLRGSYPADMLDWYQRQVPVDFIRDGDMEVMAAPADFLGVNYYETKLVAGDPGEPYHQARVIPAAHYLDLAELTANGIDARPAGLGAILRRVHEATPLPLYITENGAAYHDYVDPEGGVDDVERVAYLAGHFARDAGRDRGRGGRARLLRLVAAGQLRVGRRLQPPVRPGLGGLRHAGPHPQGQRPLVRRAHRGSRLDAAATGGPLPRRAP